MKTLYFQKYFHWTKNLFSFPKKGRCIFKTMRF